MRGAGSSPSSSWRPGDELLIEGLRADLLKIKDIKGLDFKADVHLADRGRGRRTTKEEQTTIVEGVLLPRSPLIGPQPAQPGVQGALRPAGAGHPSRRPAARDHQLGAPAHGRRAAAAGHAGERRRRWSRATCSTSSAACKRSASTAARAPLAAAIFALAIVAATFKLASLPVAMLGGAFLMLLTRCLSPEEAYRQVEWKALILIGALLSLGAAMETQRRRQISGAAADRRGRRARATIALLTCFFVLTVVLTQPMSNQAAALVVLPDRHADGDAARRRPARLRHDGGRGRELLLPDAARALLPHGLRPGQIPVLRLLQGRRPAHPDHLRHRHLLVPMVWPL